MNFKYIFLLYLLLGCGVKSDPKPPAHRILPSILSPYMSSANIFNEGTQAKTSLESDSNEEKDAKKKKR